MGASEKATKVQAPISHASKALLYGVDVSVSDLQQAVDFFSSALLFPLPETLGNELCFARAGANTIIRAHKTVRDRHQMNGSGFCLTYPTRAELAATVAAIGMNCPQSLLYASRVRQHDRFHVTGCDGMTVELTAVSIGPDAVLDPDGYLADHLTDEGKTNAMAAVYSEAPTLPSCTVSRINIHATNLRSAVNFYRTLGYSAPEMRSNGLALSNGVQELVLLPRQPRITGFAGVCFAVPDQETLESLADNLRRSGYAVSLTKASLSVVDPDGTLVTVLVHSELSETLA